MGGMTSSEDQKAAFQDRINRIREKSGQPPMPVVAPQAEAPQIPSKVRHVPQRKRPQKEVRPVPSIWENLGYPMSLVGAFLIGMIAVFAARYARFHIMGGSLVGEDADIAMMIDGALAFGVGFIFRSFFNFESQEYITAKTIGIAAMIALMHNLVHWAPGLFVGLFDEDYVLMTLEMTEPNSILFRGVSFVLSEPETAQATVQPTFIEIGR